MKALGRSLPKATADKFRLLLDGQYRSSRDAVLSGKRNASVAEVAKVRRHVDSLSGAGRWTFNAERGMEPLMWLAANFKHGVGLLKGKAFRPEPWETFDLMDIFGWEDRESGVRRYTQAYWQIPRKNGKSTIGGGVADYMAFGDGYPGAHVAIAANSLEQAGEPFKRAEQGLVLARHPGIESFNSRTYKTIKWGGCQVDALTAVPRDGKLLHAVLLDEFHEAKDTGLLDSFLSGMIADPESLTLIITTSGPYIAGPCHQEYEKCLKIVSGGIQAERYWVGIYEAEKDDDPGDEAVWSKANPNLGVRGSVDLDALRDRYDKSKNSSSELNVFRTKNLNMWVYSLTRWANMVKWTELCCEPIGFADGERCYGGIDLAGNSDFAALTLDFPPNDGTAVHRQKYMFWVPTENVEKIQRQCSIPLEQWIVDGYVIATPGPVIDYAYIAEYLEVIRTQYQLVLIAGDRYRLIDLARVCPSWFSEITYEFSQAKQSMSPTTLQFERAYLTGLIASGGNPVMSWMMSCAEAYTDSNANVKLVKPKTNRSAARIDGVIASIMAYDASVTQEPAGITMEDLANAISFF